MQPLARYGKPPWLYLSRTMRLLDDALDLPGEQGQHHLTLEL